MSPTNTMKRRIFIFAVLVIFTLSGCLKIENYTNVDEQFGYVLSDMPVDFSGYATRQTASTKADTDYFVDSGSSHLNAGTEFGVFGYFHPKYEVSSTTYPGGWKDGVNNNHPNLFYNEAVSVSESAGLYSYTYANARYWPKNAYDRISFIAYYPWSEVNASNAVVEPFMDTKYEREGMVGFYYTVQEQAEDQVDFMVSDLCLDQSDAAHVQTGSGKVKFYFHHALSQIRIKSLIVDREENEDVTVTVNYILFNNIAVFGQCIPVPDFTPPLAADGRVPVTPTWPVEGLSVRRPHFRDYPTGASADVCYDSDADTWSQEDFLLMIPQTFQPGANIEVNFDIVRKMGETGEYYAYTGNTLSAPLTTYEVSGWQAGKIYYYNIALNLKEIKISADVVDWIESGEDLILDD